MPRRVTPGSTLTGRHLAPVVGAPVAVPAPDRLVHLQFRRFAGCPVCNLHLRSIVRRHAEIEAAGVREVVVFHSPADEVREHTDELPFAVVADPDKRLYREFGVESSRWSLLSPRAWLPIVRAVARSSWGLLRGRERAPSRTQDGGRLDSPPTSSSPPTAACSPRSTASTPTTSGRSTNCWTWPAGTRTGSAPGRRRPERAVQRSDSRTLGTGLPLAHLAVTSLACASEPNTTCTCRRVPAGSPRSGSRRPAWWRRSPPPDRRRRPGRCRRAPAPGRRTAAARRCRRAAGRARTAPGTPVVTPADRRPAGSGRGRPHRPDQGCEPARRNGPSRRPHRAGRRRRSAGRPRRRRPSCRPRGPPTPTGPPCRAGAVATSRRATRPPPRR